MIRCVNCFNQYDEKFNMCPHCGYYEDLQEDPIYRLPHGTLVNNRYIVGGTLGIGGFGITYKAWDTKLETIVALKEYYPASIVNRSPGTRDVILVDKKSEKIFKFGYNRLLDEARYVAKMQGKSNIINVYAFFEENNTSYMVMEYVKGIQLRKVTQYREKLSIEEAVDITIKVCDALKVAHDQKIIHRDIAPDNIMVDIDNNLAITLIDFGNARFSGAEELFDIIVKAGFSPVEQYEKINKQGPWTDIYALGATLYYMLTGIMPEESRIRKEEDGLIPPHEVDSAIPENVSNTIMRAMAIEIHLRYQDISDFKNDLLASMGDSNKKILSVEQVVKKKKKRRAISISAAVIAIGIGAAYFQSNYSSQREEVHLPADTAITMWVSDDEKGSKKQAFEAMAKTFMDAYIEDNVTVKVVAIPQEEYQARLDEAAKNNELPEVFENVSNTDKYTDYTLDVSGIADDVSKQVYFDDEIEDNADDNEVLILGFDMPVVYLNTYLIKEEINSYADISSKLDIDCTECNDREGFLEGKEKVYYGYISDYYDVQESEKKELLIYKLIKIPGRLECEYSIGFSIADNGENENAVALRYLETMYSANGGDVMFVQNNIPALPVNREDLKQYKDAKLGNKYADFFDSIEDYKLK